MTKIVVTPGSLALSAGSTDQLGAAVYGANGTPLPGASVVWSSKNPGIATVSPTGLVTGVAPGDATLVATSGGTSVDVPVDVTTAPAASNADLVVDPSTKLQVMTGWEGTSQIGAGECDPTAFAQLRDSILDKAVDELGLNRVRLQVRSGIENPTDYYAQWKAGTIDRPTFRSHWFEIINDDADPNTTNAAGFRWSELDNNIETVVTPLRERLQAKGEKLYVNLTYVDFKASTFEHSTNPEEYAEFMRAVFDHIQSKYGWVPDAVEMILEPDNTLNWRGPSIGAAMVAAGDRLKAGGYTPAFVAPSNTNMSTAITYFDSLVQVPRVMEYLTDFAYHRYSGVSAANLAAIGARSKQYGVRTGMLEHIGSGYVDLHDDIKIGNDSSWEQFTIAFCTNDDGAQYYVIDQTNPSSAKLVMGQRTRFLRQYFLHVRLGARRVSATSKLAQLDPLAFRNTNGKFTVVVKATAAGSFTLGGIPSGTYGIFYTTGASYDVALPEVSIAAGQNVSASIPAAGAITIYEK